MERVESIENLAPEAPDNREKRNVIAGIIIRFAVTGLGFLSSILTARALGVSGRGVYFTAMTFSQIAIQFGNMGLQSSNTYYVAKDTNRLGVLVGNSLWISLLVGGLGTALYALYSQWQHSIALDSYLMWLTVLFVAPNIFYMLGTNLLVGVGKLEQYNGYTLFYNLLNVGLNVVVFLKKGSLADFLWASVFGGWIPAIALLVTLQRLSQSRLRFDLSVFREGFSYALKAYVATGLDRLITSQPILLLKQVAPDSVLGHMSIASQLGDVLIILPNTVSTFLFPRLVRSKKGRWEQMLQTLLGIGIVFMVLCLIAIPTVPIFIQLAFRAEYLGAVPYFLYRLPGVFFLGLISVVSQYLSAMGFPRSQLLVWGAGYGITLLLTHFLIPTQLGVGAAIAFSGTYGILFLMIFSLAWLYHKRTLKHQSENRKL